MKLIESSYEIIPQDVGLEGILKQIEIAARNCYKSEAFIKEGSAEKMVDALIQRGHGSPLEHGTVYLKISHTSPVADRNYMKSMNAIMFYKRNKYSKVVDHTEDHFHHDAYITTNYRVLVENNRLDDLQYLCEPTEYHEKRITAKFSCDRGVSHEFVRHRVFSFAQESTRYCNYSKDKFGNEIACILPPWELEGSYLEFEEDLKVLESIYFKWLKKGWKAQEARYFLPTGVKTEIVMTGFISDWEHFFQLRCNSTAHPQAKELAIPLKEEFIKKGFING
mgnify:CR=1 FL=1